MFADRDTLWVVHIGKGDKIPLRAREEGFICIGWTKLGDLSQYKTRQQVKAAMTQTWPSWKPGKVNACFGQVYRFAYEMQVGDPVVFPIKQTREIGIGRIKSDYRFTPPGEELHDLDYANVRDVEWLKFVPRTAFSQAALHSFGSFTSVSTSNDFLEEVVAVLKGEEDQLIERRTSDSDTPVAEEDADTTDLYDAATQETEDFLLKTWQGMGTAFEHVVAAVLEAIGYTATVTKPAGDHGVDVLAHPDPLGLEQPFIKIQAKSGAGKVGEPEVNQLIGCLSEGEKGIVIGLGGFTGAAHSKAHNSAKVSLIDARKFVALFLEHYEKLDPSWRAKYPLVRVYVPKR